MEVTNSRIKEEIVECEDLIIPDLIIPEQVSEYDISIKEELIEPIIGNLHEKSVLPTTDPFQCEICTISFSQKASLDSHNVSVHEEKKPIILNCDHCNTNFSEKRNLENHIATVHERKILILRPNENGQFNQAVEMKVHVDAVHEGHEVKNTIKCEFCNVNFSSKYQMRKHISTVHFLGKTKFLCFICNSQFGLKSSLIEHKRTVHEIKKPFECKICQRKFSRLHHVTVHLNSVHGVKIEKTEQ